MFVAVVLAAIGRSLGWLDTRGAGAATLIGAAILFGTGLTGGALLLLLFVSGSLLTFSGPRRTQPGGRRAWQVVANGAVAGGGALLVAVGIASGWPVLVGSLAAAQADTWATEIGMRSTKPPVMITSLHRVAPGTSGAISLRGTAAAFLGAVTMGGLAVLVRVPYGAVLAGVVGGIFGATLDSLLGATVQAQYYCKSCDAITESPKHRCGVSVDRTRGFAWLDNDGVNLVSTMFGGVTAVIVFWLFNSFTLR